MVKGDREGARQRNWINKWESDVSEQWGREIFQKGVSVTMDQQCQMLLIGQAKIKRTEKCPLDSATRKSGPWQE